jgi:hypothetical protein
MVLIWFASTSMAAGAKETAAMHDSFREPSLLSQDQGATSVAAPDPNLSSTRYEGAKWNTGSAITWSVAKAQGTADSPFSGYMGQEYEGLIARAFQTWSAASGLTFQEVADSPAVDIRLGWGQFHTASSGVVGHTVCQAIDGVMLPNGIVRLEDPTEEPLVAGDSGVLRYSGTTASFYQVTLHEIGHALGLADNDDPSSIMYFEAIGSKTGPSTSDTAGIRALYVPAQDSEPTLQASAREIPQPSAIARNQKVRRPGTYLCGYVRGRMTKAPNYGASHPTSTSALNPLH